MRVTTRQACLIIAIAAALTTCASLALADDARLTCPDASPCKILQLTAAEEKVLLDERGILATAAQARSLDLAGLVTYFQQKIAKAPAGDVVKPVPPVASNGPDHVGSMSGNTGDIKKEQQK